MTIDTSRTVEIEASPLKTLGTAIVGVVMTSVSATLALRLIPGVPPGSLAEFVGYVAMLFFGACTLLALWKAFTTRGPVVTITPEGIRDSRLASDLIP